MSNKFESDFLSDYADFNQSSGDRPSFALSSKVRDQIKSELKPEFKKIFMNLLLVHVFSGSLTLLVCPQFGIGPLGGGSGIVGFIEPYGHLACGLFCGSLFVSLSVLSSWFFLSLETLREIKRNQFLVYPFLGMLSFFTLSVFSLMINGTVSHLHLEYIIPWLIAASFFPILMNELQPRKLIQR